MSWSLPRFGHWWNSCAPCDEGKVGCKKVYQSVTILMVNLLFDYNREIWWDMHMKQLIDGNDKEFWVSKWNGEMRMRNILHLEDDEVLKWHQNIDKYVGRMTWRTSICHQTDNAGLSYDGDSSQVGPIHGVGGWGTKM